MIDGTVSSATVGGAGLSQLAPYRLRDEYQMSDARAVVCKQCNAPVAPEEGIVNHSADDPLQVTECGSCGAVLSVGSHRW